MFVLVKLFSVVALVAHYVSAVEPTGELEKLGKVLQGACSRRVGISEEEIEKLKAGVHTRDEKSKKYLSCLYESIKALTVDGDLQYDIIKDVTLEALKPTAPGPGVLKECFDKQTASSDFISCLGFL
ncbi:uncharacterized protein LOC114334958 [Diabrotica virgifera virgifera]|uniref:Uncharacterized protein LOC114334958 isoform X1 n=1 Tax=Diabrotica virgifera virgifera TaxID=50390 RepID=A0A6P7G1I2_DIAVI|nr:uncharacterized protein LOC114334958 [Diabrotica virgifera virgifera]